MKPFPITGTTLLIILLAGAANGADLNQTWEKISDEDGIQAYRKEVPGSQIVAFRGDAMVNAPIARVAAVVLNVSRNKEWIANLIEARILTEYSKFDRIEYNHTGSPFPVDGRDFLFRSRVTFQVPEKKMFYTMQSVMGDTLVPVQHDVVRGELLLSTYTLTSMENDQKTQVQVEIHADPKGLLPTWAANFFQKNWPTNTLRGMRQQVAKPDVLPSPEVAAIFAGTMVPPTDAIETATNLTFEQKEQNHVPVESNATFLEELHGVVSRTEPHGNDQKFSEFLNALDQGASFEGIYNSFVHSAEYRQIEIAKPGCSPKGLRTFSVELARVELELKEITQFDEKSAGTLAYAVQIGPTDGSADVEQDGTVSFRKTAAISATPPVQVKPTVDGLTLRYMGLFKDSSLYTMKRILGDEALKLVEQKKTQPEVLATWYSKWASNMTVYGVDFGHPLRNKQDPTFHYRWAEDNLLNDRTFGIERVKWEILNRVHRLLNSLG